MSQGVTVRARYRQELREVATRFREEFDLIDPYIDIERLVDIKMPGKIPGFYLAVEDSQNMGPALGYANTRARVIHIREDVYEKMRKGNEDARMVVMHEIGHLVLHTPDQILLGFTQGKILVQCSEWQADTFAAETMAHHEYLPLVTKGAREFARLTGVPVPVAVKQWHHYEREGMKSK